VLGGESPITVKQTLLDLGLRGCKEAGIE